MERHPNPSPERDRLDAALKATCDLHKVICERFGPRSPQAEASREALAALGCLQSELDEAHEPTWPMAESIFASPLDVALNRGLARARQQARTRPPQALTLNHRFKISFGDQKEDNLLTLREQSMTRSLHALRSMLHRSTAQDD